MEASDSRRVTGETKNHHAGAIVIPHSMYNDRSSSCLHLQQISGSYRSSAEAHLPWLRENPITWTIQAEDWTFAIGCGYMGETRRSVCLDEIWNHNSDDSVCKIRERDHIPGIGWLNYVLCLPTKKFSVSKVPQHSHKKTLN